jgi:macrolide transport system ATP-binding/permease protein
MLHRQEPSAQESDMGIAGSLRKLGMLLRRDRYRSELDEEMAFHRAQAQKELIAGGMTPKAARIAAMRQFGNTERLKEQSHEIIGFRFETIAQDLRFALRQLRKNPGFAVIATMILALGIGASVAIFGFVDAALIKPLPYLDSSRLAVLFESNPLGPRFHLSYLDYLDWKKLNKSFSSVDVYAGYGFLLTTPDGIQPADGARVSSGFLHTLGVVPLLGRDFAPNESEPSAPHVVLLSYGAWQKRYGGRRDVLGQTVVLDGDTHTIIGVLPATFHFAPAEPAEFWAAERPDRQCEKMRGCHNLFGLARLRDGVSFASASADVKAIAEQLEKQYPDTNGQRSGWMRPLTDEIVGEIRPILLVLLSGAALLLLIATVNVASLLMVRSESRRREIAVRGALGASAGRLVRQFVTEGLLLASAGSVLGVAFGIEAMQLLTRLVPKGILARMPYLLGLGLNLRVAAFAALICAVTGLVFALTPTFRLSLTDMRQGLTDGGRGSAGTIWRRFGANLVVIELATAMVLLVGAGLLGKSLYRLLRADAGLEPDHLATLRISAVGERYAKNDAQINLGREILSRVAALPGVKSVGITSSLPLGDGDGTSDFRVVGRSYSNDKYDEAANREVTAGYLPTLQARIIRGRNFSDDEDQHKPSVMLVNQTLAIQLFRGQDPVGQRIQWGGEKTPHEIIGIVNDLQEGQLDAAPRAAFYIPFNESPDGSFAIVVRVSQNEQSILPAMVATMHQLDPGIAVFEPSTMGERIHDSPSAYLHRTSAWMVGMFAAIALVLSAVGLYGVVAYSVSQRTREIGVRMALGAPRGSVYSLILKEAGWLTGIGVALGLVCSLGAATLMRKLLFGTAAWDAETFAGVAIVLAGAAMLASFIPARRAAGVDPAEALRTE